MTNTASPLSSALPTSLSLPSTLKSPQSLPDYASDSTTSDHHKGPIRHLKVRITRRTRLFKLRVPPSRSHFRLIQSIEGMLQLQAPVTPHPVAAMPTDQKRSLLGQLCKRVVVIEDTIHKATTALQLLLQYM